MSRLSRINLLRILLVAGVVAVLEALCRTQIISSFTMIPPSAMVLAAWQQLREGQALAELAYTLSNAGCAIVISVVGGFAIGTMLHAVPRVRHAVTPLLASWYAIPTFVFYPLLVVLFGLNRGPMIALGALFGIVAMVVSTLDGLDRIAPAVVKTGRVLRMHPLQTAWLIKLPAAAPHLFTGVKLAVAYSLIGVIAAEFILATAGIGRGISLAFNDLDNNTMYGLLLLLLVVVTLINMAIRLCESRLYARWGLK
jgi:NitT/TauT family transport system permease protein